MSPRRIPALALAADVAAVVVFAAIGRLSHGESDDLLGLLGTVAPFAAGLAAAWAVPRVRMAPVSVRSGGIVLVGTVVVGLLLRAAFTGRLPVTFVLITTITLAVLLLGWRALAMVVARRVAPR